MTPKVEFHFDFGSPNAYLAHKVIPAIEQRTGASSPTCRSCWAACSSSPTTGRRSSQFKDVKAQAATTRSSRSGASSRSTGSTKFRMNPHFPVNTVQIMRGAVAAEMDGKFATYVDAVFRHMWEDG